jgi:competence protein ComEC
VSLFAKLAAAFTAGVAFGAVLPVPALAAIAGTSASVILVFLSASFRCRAALTALAAVFVAGWCRAPLPAPAQKGVRPSAPCTRVFSAEVEAPPVRLEDRLRVELLADAMTACADSPEPPALEPTELSVSLTVLGASAPRLAPGDRVLVRATVKITPSFANFGVAKPRSFSGEHLSAVAETSGSLARISKRRVDVGGALASFRERLASFWGAHLEEPRSGLARALVVGESGALDPEQRDRFRRTGTAHLLAVSGLHLSILTWLVFGLSRRALLFATPLSRRFDVGRIAAALTIPFLVAFSMLVGGSPPVARSCVMATCILAGRASGRRGGALEALSLAAASLLAFDPTDIADPGFQLSFAAVTSFLLGARDGRGERTLGGADDAKSGTTTQSFLLWVSRSAKRLFFGSLAATAATTPIALYHFDQISVVAIPCNMAAIPFTSLLVMPALFIVSGLALFVPSAASLGAVPVDLSLRALDAMLGLVARLRFAAFDCPAPSLSIAVVVCSAAGLVFASRRCGRSFAAFATALGLAAVAAWARPAGIPEGRFSIHVLDVGQGSAAVVAFPDGRAWLVDAGGSAKGPEFFGERHLVPAVRGLGVKEIHALLLSHADPDHVVGAPAILRSFHVGELWISGFAEEEKNRELGSPYREALETARRSGVVVRTAKGICGSREIAGVRVEVLHPCIGATGFDPALTANDNSLVLRFTYGRTSFLLPGDLSRDGEALLVASGALSRTDVLVLGHHGSDSSTTADFLDAVRPSIAVASVGRDNRYGFPRAEVVSALAHRNVSLHRADREGALRIVSDGARISVTKARND